jgi:hypothetical protein
MRNLKLFRKSKKQKHTRNRGEYRSRRKTEEKSFRSREISEESVAEELQTGKKTRKEPQNPFLLQREAGPRPVDQWQALQEGKARRKASFLGFSVGVSSR